MSRIAFTSIMVAQSDHVMMTILMMHKRMDPVLCKLALKKTGQKGVNVMGISLIVLAFEWSEHEKNPFHKSKVLHSIFGVFVFANSIQQRDSIDARDNRKITDECLALLGPLMLILELAGTSHLGVSVD